MTKFDISNLTLVLNKFFLITTRVAAFFSGTSIFGKNSLTKTVQLLLVITLSPLLLPFISIENIPNNIFFLSKTILQEICIGIILGLMSQIFFSIPIIAGEILSLQIGLSFSTFFNINNQENSSILSNFFKILYTLLFFSLGGHLFIISSIVKSFSAFPIGSQLLNKKIEEVLLLFFIKNFTNGIMLIFPITAFMLILNIILAFLNRISPQMSIFSTFLPTILFMGLCSIFLSIPNFLSVFYKNYTEYLNFVNNLLDYDI